MDCEFLILADASGSKVRAAIVKNGELLLEIESDSQAMESFHSTIARLCEQTNSDIKSIKSFALAEGPGSMLGTRTASAFLSTIAWISDAKFYVWDCLLASAYAYSKREKLENLRLLAPSRKGFVNICSIANNSLDFEGELAFENAKKYLDMPNTFLLPQRKTAELQNFQEANLKLAEIFEVLKEKNLATQCQLPPDAMSLGKREYVKWKAQAHI